MSSCCCIPLGVLAASNVTVSGGGGGGSVALQTSDIVSATTTAGSFSVNVNTGIARARLFVLMVGTTQDGSSPTGEVSNFSLSATIGGTGMTQPAVENGTSWLNAAFTQGGRLEQRFIEESSLASSQTLTISFDDIGGVSGQTTFTSAVTHSVVFAVFDLDTNFGKVDGFVGRGTGGADSSTLGATEQELFFGASIALIGGAGDPTWGGTLITPSVLTPESWIFDNCKMTFGYTTTQFSSGGAADDVSIDWNSAVDYIWVGSHGNSPTP